MGDRRSVAIWLQLLRTFDEVCGVGGCACDLFFQEHWRHWETMERSLEITPTGKRVPGIETCYADKLCDTIPMEALNPMMPSAPYSVKWLDGPSTIRPMIELKDGSMVDIGILEDEEEDSYA